MKKILFSIIVLILCQTNSAQQLTWAHNIPLAGDSISKQQVEYKDPLGEGKGISWDFRSLNPINEKYALHYSTLPQKDSTFLCGLEHHTRYYYDLQSDSLWLTGYENPTTYMKYSTPELRLRFPFAYGDSLSSEFQGEGEYCHRIPLKVKGDSHTKVDAEGELILPNNIKINKALRLNTLRHYTETGKDSMSISMETYTWYVPGNRYPVFESIKSTTHYKKASNVRDTVYFATSFYYPPVKQNEETEEENNNTEDIVNPDKNEFAHLVSYLQTAPNPVENILTISFELERNADMQFSIHNNMGNSIYSCTPKQYETGSHKLTINMGSQTPGIYTLHIQADNMVESLILIKK
jgi:hypothetical protein